MGLRLCVVVEVAGVVSEWVSRWGEEGIERRLWSLYYIVKVHVMCLRVCVRYVCEVCVRYVWGMCGVFVEYVWSMCVGYVCNGHKCKRACGMCVCACMHA